MEDVIKEMINDCEISAQFNVGPTIKLGAGKQNFPLLPGKKVVMDYTVIRVSVSGMRVLLILVEAYTGWPEAYPYRNEESKSVIKTMVTHDIPTRGFQRIIRSDNGTHIKKKDFQAVGAMLSLIHWFGTVNYLHSQG